MGGLEVGGFGERRGIARTELDDVSWTVDRSILKF